MCFTALVEATVSTDPIFPPGTWVLNMREATPSEIAAAIAMVEDTTQVGIRGLKTYPYGRRFIERARVKRKQLEDRNEQVAGLTEFAECFHDPTKLKAADVLKANKKLAGLTSSEEVSCHINPFWICQVSDCCRLLIAGNRRPPASQASDALAKQDLWPRVLGDP